jgi:hypothetical protein
MKQNERGQSNKWVEAILYDCLRKFTLLESNQIDVIIVYHL